MQFDGLPKYRIRGSQDSWDWSDWGKKETEDKEVIQAALYYMALKSAREMAEELGHDADFAWYDERIDSIQNAFNAKYWTGDYYSSDPGVLQDDRANCLTILSGLAAPERYEAIVNNVLIPNHYCSPHFEWMVQLAMCQAGYHEAALERMKARYGRQVDMKHLSTLYEMFPIGGTYNHAWNAPNTILSQEIAGIAPTQPGWSEYHILPYLGQLNRVKQVVPSVKGTLSVEMMQQAGSFEMNLVSPVETVAIVGIPKALGEVAEIKANEVIIWKKGEFVGGVRGIQPHGEDAAHIQFKVAPGTWRIQAFAQ